MSVDIAADVLRYCESGQSVSSLVARESSLSPAQAANKLFGSTKKIRHASFNNEPSSAQELQKARACGNWGETQPGQLFLQAFHDVLCCLNEDPLMGVVSPSLVGSHGTIPLTIVAPLVEITHHCANMIVRAKKEVIIATCSWSSSVASKLIGEALRELSKRAQNRKEKVAIKFLYGNPGISHLIHNRQDKSAEVSEPSGLQLPPSTELSNLDVEAMSIHQPLLGTLHAKFVIIDRKIAIIQSNNVEDNSNLEMMTHLEGPIVDSVYDYTLNTWKDAFKIPSPTSRKPASQSDSVDVANLLSEMHTGRSSTGAAENVISIDEPISYPSDLKTSQNSYNPSEPFYAENFAEEISRITSIWGSENSQGRLTNINRRFNDCYQTNIPPRGPEISSSQTFQPFAINKSACPIALVGRKPYGGPDNLDINTPQNAAWIACIRHAQFSVFIQSPDVNAYSLNDALISAVRRGVEVTYYVCLGYNNAGEEMPGQGGTNEKFAIGLYKQLSETERHNLRVHWFVGRDQLEPIHHKFKQRSCHLKLLIVDDEVGIQGSGNQDTQSWCHSQEINIMIDSKEICKSWRDLIENSQNSAMFGRGSSIDGIWRDKEGKEAVGSPMKLPAPFSWFQGAIGMFQKAKEKGSFG